MSFWSFVLSQFVCIPWVRKPFETPVENPFDHGMNNTDNVRIQIPESEDIIGAWFVHPFQKASTSNQPTEWAVKSGEVAFLYLHGNAQTRAAGHRKQLYDVFQRLGHHVLAIDYRSYGDSSFIWRPNEQTMSQDAICAYAWLRERCHPDAKIFVWGHSLGSGVTAKMAWLLSQGENQQPWPTGIVLEAPFSSLFDEITSFYASTFIPLDIPKQLRDAHLEFNSVENLKVAKSPILILHAKDDKVIPFALGKKLSEEVSASAGDVTFISYNEDIGLGHTDIAFDKNIGATIQNFVLASIEKSNSNL